MEKQGKKCKFLLVVIVLAGLMSGFMTMSYVYDKKKIIPYGYFMPKFDPRITVGFDTLCIKVLDNADERSYTRLERMCFSDEIPLSNLFYYSLAMIKKNQYKYAYYDAYKSIMYLYEQNPLIWMPMDSVTNAIAVSFLEKGVEMQDERAWKEKYIRDLRGW